MLTPTTFRVRHLILKELLLERNKLDQKHFDSSKCDLSKNTLSTRIKVDVDVINNQLDVLWQDNCVYDNTYDNEIRYFITSEGMSVYGQQSIKYQGMLTRSQILNSWSTSIVQIILAFIAIVTLYINLSSIKALEAKSEKIEKELQLLQLDIQKQQQNLLHPTLSVDSMANFQTIEKISPLF